MKANLHSQFAQQQQQYSWKAIQLGKPLKMHLLWKLDKSNRITIIITFLRLFGQFTQNLKRKVFILFNIACKYKPFDYTVI